MKKRQLRAKWVLDENGKLTMVWKTKKRKKRKRLDVQNQADKLAA